MKIAVLKFGGTSVSTEERRIQVVKKIKVFLENGYLPVVVVSAMGRKDAYSTDTLLSLVDLKFKKQNKLSQDLLVSCGEIISAVILCNELFKVNINSIPLTGGQAGIITDDNFTNSKLLMTDVYKIKKLLEKNIIPVVAGFQGQTSDGYITTLGRGGSDTSACILGVALKASEIYIYTDVDGLMTSDPRIVSDASLIKEITYTEVFQLANQGAKVIHPKAVQIAKEGNIPIIIKNTLNDNDGTTISNAYNKQNKAITGITYLNNRVQIRIAFEDNENNENYKSVLNYLAKNNVSLDLINIFPTKQIFTIDDSEKEKVENLLKSNNIIYSLIEDCTRIALVGLSMKGVPGIISKVIDSLNKENIEVLQTSDSNMTIWCLIKSIELKKANTLLHKVFNLGK